MAPERSRDPSEEHFMYRIQPLKVGECHTEEGPKMYFLRDFDKVYSTFFYFWYVEGAGTRILIDVGFNPDDSRDIMPTMIQKPEWLPAARLEQIGVEPESIEHIVVTHLHFDHLSSAIDLFPNARLYLQQREYETAVRPPHPWFVAAYLPQIVERLDGDLKPRLEIIDGEAEILPGLRLVHVGGHTPGLQMVLLPTDRSPRTCLTSDLCFHYRHIEEDLPIGLFSNLIEVYAGLAHCRHEADLIIPNHDPRLEQEFPLPVAEK
jgi:glyoxylase-like metal-dependent hydrolase (beta-lactamase superfamily II)